MSFSRWGAWGLLWAACLAGLIGGRRTAAEGGAEATRRALTLRVETGMHTAPIKSVAADPQGRFLVTASDDRTARVWDVESGRLLRTLRVPTGAGPVGKLYAAAVSPDGQTVALGGYTGDQSDARAIYLVDPATGQIRRTLGSIASVVNRLAFSPDGARLYAVLGGRAGLCAWRADTGERVACDDDPGDSTYGLAVLPDGRLLSASYDGKLCLYDGALRRLRVAAAPGGEQPYGVAASPDGAEVAVGYSDSTRVDVLDSGTLTLLRSADTSLADNGNLSSVAFRSDGALCAGGRFYKGGGLPILCWPRGGRVPARLLAAAADTVLDLAPLSGGRLAWGSGDPAWGWLSPKGETGVKVTAETAHFNNQAGVLATNQTGSVLFFGYDAFGRDAARFDLARGTLSPAAGAADLQVADTARASVSRWQDDEHPAQGDAPLLLKKYESSRSLASLSSGFLLGTDWYLRAFDAKGAQRWQSSAPGATWAVVPSGDGRVAIAAHADGTLRWYDVRDGHELIALFPHADHRRWVAWTPSGYYAASPGGEELVGWEIDRGPGVAPDFVPAAAYRDRYYRPDVVARMLDTLDEGAALAAADAARAQAAAAAGSTAAISAGPPRPAPELAPAPPVVSVLSPATGAEVRETEIRLQVEVRTSDGRAVREVWALVDGARQGAAATRSGPDGRFTLNVPMPPKDATIAVLARTDIATSAYTENATVFLRWRGIVPSEARALPPGYTHAPTLYVLAVGADAYSDDRFGALAWPHVDADRFAKFWKQQTGRPWAAVEVRSLAGAASREDVIDQLAWLRRSVTRDDVGVILLDGHGAVAPSSGVYYFAPTDADQARREATWISQSVVIDTLRGTPGKIVLFLDTCQSGALSDAVADATRGGDLTPFLEELSDAGTGVVTCYASTRVGLAAEDARWGGGAFTKVLLEGLAGAASSPDGYVRIDGLDDYLSKGVRALTKGEQEAGCHRPQGVTDFPIAIAPGR